MKRKGQAAMEFLMTYGWAILAAIIAIGVLAYFGVFSPGKYAPSATVVNPPFYAQGAVVSAGAGTVSIELQNNGGEDVTISNVAVEGCTVDASTSTPIAVGARDVFIMSTCTATAGSSFKGDVTITYRKTGGGLDLTSTGTISQQAVA